MKKKTSQISIATILAALLLAVVWNIFPKGAEPQNTVPGSVITEEGEASCNLSFRREEQLEEHYEKHGIEMGYASKDDYLAGANAVIANPDALHKLEAEDGDDVYYLEETNEFVIVSTDGYIRTYFWPQDGIAYYNRQ